MQQRVPKRLSLLLFLFLLSNYLSATPECPIITAKFTGADGATSDGSSTGWFLDASRVASSGIFAVKSKRLHAQELGGEGIWYSRVFSTAGYSNFQVAVKVHSEGDMNSSEYVKIYYKINGGAETLLDSRTGNFGTIDFTSGILTGSNVQLVVKIYNYNNGGSQTSKYYIEEYRVFKEDGPCTVSAITATAAAANGGVLTCSNGSLALSATATGSGTTTWSWTGPNGYTSSAQNPTITAAGTYTVVATNSSGSGSASVTVAENKTAPVITATGGALACGSCVNISATSNVSGATYSWSGPNSFTSTSQNPTVCAAGTYTVTVTNPANGCSAQQDVTVSAGSASVSTFWLEDFAGLSNGATSDGGTTGWTTSVTGSGTYSVQSNEYKTSFSGSQGVGTWTSQLIDISSRSNVTFSVDLRSATGSTNDAFESADYIRVYYKLNGGSETLIFDDAAGIGNTTNGTASTTVNSASLNGSTLQIIIKTSNSDPTERYFFDNIKVSGSSAGTGTATVTPSVNGTVTCTATAQLSATASGSITAWSWTGPNGFTSSIQSPVVSAGGQYIVTATLSSGCAVSGTITVAENKTAPDISASGGTLACLPSITLNVSSGVNGATYSWTGPGGFTSTSKNPTVTVAGNYTATVTNPANGCTAQQTITVSNGSSATPATFWLEDFSDHGNGATSDAGPTGWTTSTSGSGTYSVQNNEFKTSFSAQAEGIWASQVIDIAGKSNVTISVDLRSETASGNDAFENLDYIRVYYKLNDGSETLIYEDVAGISNTTSGTASVTVNSAALSGSTLQVIIKTNNSGPTERYYFDNVKLTGADKSAEVVIATGGAITCASSSVTLLGSSTSGGLTYNWTGPNGFTSTNQNPVVSATGIYNLTVFNPATGCSGTDTALVVLNTAAPEAVASAGGSLTCTGNSSVTLSGSSFTLGVTYSWTGPNGFTSTVQNPVVTAAGTYYLRVTDPLNGCTSAAASTTVTRSITSTGTIWLEDFTLNNGTSADNGASSWSTAINPSTTLFSVLNNEFRISNSTTTIGTEGAWTSGAIDITGKTNISISADVRSSVINNVSMNTISTDPVKGDYIRFYYKLDNGAEVKFAEKNAEINNHSTTPATVSVSLTGLSGSNLRIVVRARATAGDEFYYFDNMKVAATSSSNASAIATGGALTCINNSVTLQGSSAISGVSYAWTGPDGFSSSATNPVVNAAGTYTLTVTDPSTGCTGSDTALVSLNNTPPGADASASGSINCTNGSSAGLSGSSPTSGVTYSWTGPNGFTSTAQNPVVTKAGTYNLTVTNPVNGCTSTASATMAMSNTMTGPAFSEDFSLPNGATSDSDASGWSTTRNPSSALFSVLNNEFRISNCSTTGEGVWTSAAIDINGKTNISISAGVKSSIINNAVMNTDPTYGDYLRFYYKIDNGAEVLFAEKTAGINDHSTTFTPVSVSGITGGGNTLRIVVRARATGNNEFYYFDNVQVVATGTANVTATATGGSITCTNNSVTLQGSTSATGASYAWSGPNGYTSSAQNPVVSTAGNYSFTVSLGGCTASATAIVSTDTTRPNITATASQLTCIAPNAALSGNSSTSGVSYSWTNASGSVIATTANTSVTNTGNYTFKVTNPANGCFSTTVKTVGIDTTKPNVTATAAQLTCTATSAALSGGSSTSGVSYSWTNASGSVIATTANTSVTNAGTYTLRVTNAANGCFSTATAVVNSDTAKPNISASAAQLTCTATSAALSGSSSTSGVNYSWTNASGSVIATTANTSVTNTGNYTFKVTNPANGCFSTTVKTVGIDTTRPVVVTLATNITCASNVALLAAASSISDVSYGWTNASGSVIATTATTSVTNAGNYTVKVTNPANGCFSTSVKTVGTDTSKPAATAMGSLLTCVAANAPLTGGSTTPGVSYSWTNASGSVIATTALTTVTSTGNYTLKVTNPDNGCFSTRSVVVNIDTAKPNLTASANPIQLTCTQTPATLFGSSTTSGVSWNWSKGNIVIATTPTASVTDPGTYTCTVTNPANGCSSASQVEVTQNVTPPPAITASHTGTVTCNTPNATISGTVNTPGLTLKWTGPNGYMANTLTASVTRGGTYTLTATNPINGCSTSAFTTIDENTVAPGEISMTNPGPITCLTSSITLTGQSSSSNVTYLWTGPNGYSKASTSAKVERGGVYTLTATNQVNGCKSSKSTTVVENNAAPVITITNTSPITCTNSTVRLKATSNASDAQYVWAGPEDFVAFTPDTTTIYPGIYIISVTNRSNGCIGTEFTEVWEDYSNCGARKATTTSSTTAATPVVSNFTYSAYPNPVTSNGVIEFTSPGNTAVTVSMYNTLGVCEKVLFKGNAAAGQRYRLPVPAAQLHAGAYYYIINAGGKTYSGRLVIVK